MCSNINVKVLLEIIEIILQIYQQIKAVSYSVSAGNEDI